MEKIFAHAGESLGEAPEIFAGGVPGKAKMPKREREFPCD